MPFKRVSQKFNASIKEVVIGTGSKAVTFGGENVTPLYSFDEPIKNPPKIGIEVSDRGPNLDLPDLKKFYAGCSTIPEFAKKAITAPGVSFVALVLEKADPNGDNVSVDDCVKLAKDVSAAVGDFPLVVQGCKNVEKDGDLFNKVAEALEGKNVLFMSCKEENHKKVAVGAVQAYKAKIGAESAVDINLAKQLNTVITQTGVTLDNVIMNVGQSAAGYGFEYLVSTLDRIKAAALAQNDVQLQVPIIIPAGQEAWGVKEAVASEADFPEWGSQEQRGISMEISTAASSIAAGANGVILKHPKSIETVSKIVAALM
ncbi:MAG: acetyl-CoA decarbonylase/synthase complex subunit delta [Spirochaetaceae bacterium]|jgi:acetyl-CoA decarbonylase/synthase complex subunit delta|nr:acetyl-CoA decarbonylase/synthase complex subunit delta [Spirochaetaceae bacterium]